MCDKCGAAFTQNRLLVRHKLLHLRAPGNKLPGRGRRVQNGTIKCELCESMFINLNSLRRHLRKYHNNQPSIVYDEKRKTTCSKCNLTFEDPKQLTRHKFTHLEFECDICKQRYSTNKALDAHKNIHGNKVHPFKCSVSVFFFYIYCGYFISPDYLLINFLLLYRNVVQLIRARPVCCSIIVTFT